MAGESLGKATFALEADTKRFQSDMQQAKGIANKTTKNIGNKFKSMGQNMMQAGQGLTMAVTAPIIGVMAISGKAFLDYDKSLNRIRFLTKATAEDLPAIEKAVLDIAKAVGVMPTEAAGAFYFALSSGAKDSEQAIMVLTQTLRASAMGLGDAETITRVVLGLINAYNLEMEEATIVTGQFISMIESGLAEPEELANSLGRVVLVAKNMAVEVWQIMAGVSALTVTGMASGPKAVTMVSGFFRSMVRMSKRQQDLWEHPTLSLKELIELIGVDLGLAMKTINEAFDANFTKLKRFVGSAEAANAIMAIGSKEGFAVYAESIDEMGGAGERSLEKWEKFTKTYEYKLNQLKVEWQATLIELGRSFVPVLIPLVKVFKGFFKLIQFGTALFTALPKPIKIVVLGLLLFLAALGPILLIAGLLFGAIGGIILGFTQMGITVAGTMAFMILWLPIIAAVVVALALLSYAVIAVALYFGEIKAAASSVLQSFEKIAYGAEKLGGDIIIGITKGIIAATSALYRVVGTIVQTLIDTLNPFKWVFGSTMEDVYEDSGTTAGKALINALDRAIQRGLSGVIAAITQPLEAMRRIVSDLRSELDRLGGLSTVESLAEDLKRAELMLAQFGSRKQTAAVEKQIAVIKRRIAVVDDEIRALDLERKGRNAATDAIDRQTDALDRERSRHEKSLKALEKKLKANDKHLKQINSEINVLMVRRNAIIMATGDRTDETDAIDEQVEALGEEKIGIEKAKSSIDDKIETVEELIDTSDDEIGVLADKRRAIVETILGRRLETKAIDRQIKALRKEKTSLKEASAARQAMIGTAKRAVEKLDDLAKSRELERAVLVARAAVADRTLATDAEVFEQLRAMEGIVAAVTGVLDEQVDRIHTRFIPAWEGVIDTLNEVGGALGGADAGVDVDEIEFPELGELEPFLEEIDWDVQVDELKKGLEGKLRKFVKDMAPIFMGTGIALLIAFFLPFSIPLLAAAAVGALIGILWIKFHDEIIAFGKKMAGWFTSAFGSVKDAVVTFFSKTLPGFFTDTIPGAFSGLLGIVETFFTETLPDFFAETVSGAFSSLLEPIDTFFTETLSDFFTEIIPGALLGLLETLGSAAKKLFTPRNIGLLFAGLVVAFVIAIFPPSIAIALIIKFRKQIGGFFSKAGKFLLKGITKTIPKFIGDHWKDILTVLFPVPMLIIRFRKQIASFGTKAGKALLKLLTKTIPKFIGDHWKDILTVIFPVPMLIIRFRKQIASFGTEVGEALLNFLTKTLPEFIGDHWKDILTVLFPMPMLAILLSGRLADLLSTIIEWGGAVADWLGDNLHPWKWIKEAFQGFIDGITGVLGFIWGSGIITKWVGKLGKWLKTNMNPWTWVKVAWQLFQDKIGTKLNAIFKTVTTFFKDLPGEATAAIGDVASTLYQKGKDLLSGLWKGLKWYFTTYISVWLDIADKVKSAVGKVTETLEQKGKDLAQGLWDGLVEIFEGAKGILTWAGEIGTSLANAITDAFKAAWNSVADVINKAIPDSIGFDAIKIAGKTVFPSTTINLPPNPLPQLYQRGVLKVPGTGTRDEVPARLTPGEMVLPRDAAQVLRDFFSGRTETKGGDGNTSVSISVEVAEHEEIGREVARQLKQAAFELDARVI